jgi:protein TonB
VREVRPEYTTEARRRAIEGDVDLEIVVRVDGSVGQVRIVRGLEPGLDQKATEAVRQWRFAPARRQGVPLEVVVQVSVAFKLW